MTIFFCFYFFKPHTFFFCIDFAAQPAPMQFVWLQWGEKWATATHERGKSVKNECKQECKLEKWANKVRALEQQQHSTIFVAHISSLCKHQGGVIDKCQKMNKQVAFCRLHSLDFLFKSRVFFVHCFLLISAITFFNILIFSTFI